MAIVATTNTATLNPIKMLAGVLNMKQTDTVVENNKKPIIAALQITFAAQFDESYYFSSSSFNFISFKHSLI